MGGAASHSGQGLRLRQLRLLSLGAGVSLVGFLAVAAAGQLSAPAAPSSPGTAMHRAGVAGGAPVRGGAAVPASGKGAASPSPAPSAAPAATPPTASPAAPVSTQEPPVVINPAGKAPPGLNRMPGYPEYASAG